MTGLATSLRELCEANVQGRPIIPPLFLMGLIARLERMAGRYDLLAELMECAGAEIERDLARMKGLIDECFRARS